MADLVFPFDKVPAQIRDWLLSETVDSIIQELLARHASLKSRQQRAIPQIVTAIPLQLIKIDEVISTLVGRYKIEPTVAEDIAKTLKSRVFDPIKTSMQEAYGISVADILKKPPGPAARTMTIEKPTTKPVVPAPKPVAPRPPAPPPPPVPKARVTEMTQVIDIRRPVTPAAAKPVVPAAPKPAPIPVAQTMKIEGDFSAGGSNQRSTNNYETTNGKGSPAQTAPKKPEGESDVLETKKEFGLAEAIPKPPQPQEVEEYEDHHPTVE